MTEDEKVRRETMGAAIKGTLEHFSKDNPTFTTTVRAVGPSDPVAAPMYKAAFQALGDQFPADGPVPDRATLIQASEIALNWAGLARIDCDDGTDYAETLADAYTAARANYTAQASIQVGNA